jgi:ParB family chromosome partitioning protein
MEEAEGYWHLKDKFGMTQEEVAERVGKDRTTVANAIRLLKLPAEIRAQVEDGLLSAGHARTLLAISSAADQELLAREFLRRGLSVRAAEARVQAFLAGAPKKKTAGPEGDPDTRDAEQRLQRALGTKVEIRRRKKGGEVRLSFYSEEQLIGLFERLVGSAG